MGVSPRNTARANLLSREAAAEINLFRRCLSLCRRFAAQNTRVSNLRACARSYLLTSLRDWKTDSRQLGQHERSHFDGANTRSTGGEVGGAVAFREDAIHGLLDQLGFGFQFE